MRRNNRYPNRRDDLSPMLILSGIGLLLAIVTFIIIFFVYKNKINSLDLTGQDVAQISDIGDSVMNTGNATSDVSSDISKTINEMINFSNNASTNNNIINQNTSTNNMNNTVTNSTIGVNNATTNSTNTTTKNIITPAPAKVVVPDPVFKMPVEGKIIREFAKDNLVYSQTLQEWVTHPGIDIASSEGTIVKASADGTVDSVKNDPRYGLTVIIKHVNGYKTVYSNLETANYVKKGDKVKTGQSIGTVGNTAAFEVEDASHLHFEMTKNNVNVNPSLYIK
ncbi:MAG: M23 family metallopeptidase [Oscillospiraceae bacterium]|nr:M23 family metallopeptidase [Oscillospiraceae bacterium]